MDSTSLETLQLSFGNLRVEGMFEIDGSTTPLRNRVSSSLPLNGSLTGVLPGPVLSNRESILDSSKTGSFAFNLMNLNGASFAENLTGQTLNAGYGFVEPYLYNLASQGQKDSMFNNVNCLSVFSNANSGLSFQPKAISTGRNLLGNGFNISTENSSGLWNQQSINGIPLPPGNEIITLAMTEDGSKYFQDLLLLIDDTRITKLIFEGVIEYIFQLMTNQYGRYLFKHLVESDDDNQLRMIVEKLTVSDGHIFYASIDRYGSYSIKKLIEVLKNSPLVVVVVKALCNKFWELMINPTGQYVIMECLEVVDSQKNDLLYMEAINKCLQLATHERGCISLNSFILRIKGRPRDQLLNLISDHVVYLAQDPAGNFVVQCVLGLQNPEIIDKICSKLKGYYVKLSMQKGGSHVVEKCLRSSGMDHVVHEFLQSNQLFQVAKDQYGNYVLQTALRETKRMGSSLHESLIMKLQQHLNSLQHGFGRNILKLMTASPVK